MGLTAVDILVLLLVVATAAFGAMRGFVTEVLSLLAWVLVVFALKFAHTPLTHALTGSVGTPTGAAVLAFALIAGLAWFGGRLLAQSIGARTRDSILGPLDRAMGLGFGALKGLILASLAFLLLVLVFDTAYAGPSQRPPWLTSSRTYPLLNATSASIADFVDKRRRGRPVFDMLGNDDDVATDATADDAARRNSSADTR
ncbi:CvpA family protein [uncultured Sphingomonas sp.]|uniref:CvpA family protein n=1 Tax=uncultured Sphingomonas sp. TaxID=158754 RepID=UPI0035CA01DF